MKPVTAHPRALLATAITLLVPLFTTAVTRSAPADDNTVMLRIVCLRAPADGHELTLAWRDEDGEGHVLGTVSLRSEFISEWMTVRAGEVHLMRANAEDLTSVGLIDVPANARRVVALLFWEQHEQTPEEAFHNEAVKGENAADGQDVEGQAHEDGAYLAEVVNPAEKNAVPGKVVTVNLGPDPLVVVLGGDKHTVEPGDVLAETPVPSEGNMYQRQVFRQDPEGHLEALYDRYVATRGDAREWMGIVPHSTLGIEILSITEFGPFE